ncbi:MAG TPA: CvpA family protein [Verrucomicrobiae bacterium]|jgi:uncharacterized membrane protein required for colicin V production
MSLSNFTIGWFDFLAVLTVLLGVKLGGNRGMSKEFLRFVQWCVIVLAAAVFYETVGGMISQFAHVGSTFGNVLGYLFVASVVKFIFSLIGQRIGDKIEAGHIFGRLEYHLGPVAGGVRFFCIVLLLLALLHAAMPTADQRQRDVKFQTDNYGAVYFPTLSIVNDEIFNHSFSGRWINDKLSFLLIAPHVAPIAPAAESKRVRS